MPLSPASAGGGGWLPLTDCSQVTSGLVGGPGCSGLGLDAGPPLPSVAAFALPWPSPHVSAVLVRVVRLGGPRPSRRSCLPVPPPSWSLLGAGRSPASSSSPSSLQLSRGPARPGSVLPVPGVALGLFFASAGPLLGLPLPGPVRGFWMAVLPAAFTTLLCSGRLGVRSLAPPCCFRWVGVSAGACGDGVGGVGRFPGGTGSAWSVSLPISGFFSVYAVLRIF